jgi:hypothetical protein
MSPGQSIANHLIAVVLMRSAWCCGPGGIYLSIYACFVFVRLHQALFPARGPFLPSLYVNLSMLSKRMTCVAVASCASRCRRISLSCSEARSPPLLGPSTAERSRHSLVQVTFGATLLVAVGFAWARLLFLLALRLGLGWSEVVRGWSEVACWAVALADMCGCGWILSRVGVSSVACICLCLALALCLSAPMLLGVSLVPLCNHLCAACPSSLSITILMRGLARPSTEVV